MPNRTVQSVQNVCKRKFNIYNYGGKWSKIETTQLKHYVAKYGYEWVKIGQLLGRTALNVKDKAKSLNITLENNSNKNKKYWSITEVISLLRILNKGISNHQIIYAILVQ